MADARARRRALLVVALALALGLALLTLLGPFRSGLEDWLEQEVSRWIARPALGGIAMFALSTPLWVFAWHIGRVARRTEAARRWLPPGQPVVRDTPVLSGSDAQRRARLLRTAAVLSWLLPILSGLMFWQMLTVIAG